MPAVNRDLEIVYGATTIGGTTDFLLDGKFTLTDSYDTKTFSFDTICTGSTAAIFASNCVTLEAAFRIPRQDLSVTLSGVSLISLTEGSSTGYNADPTINKVGGAADTGRSRADRVDITWERPADLSGQAGRRNSIVALNFAPGKRRTITITGRYTTLGGTGARAIYDGAIEGYTTSIIASVGGPGAVFELVSEDANADDNDTNIDFTRIFRELIFNQSEGVLDDDRIFDSIVQWSRSIPAPGDLPLTGPRRR